MSSLLRYQRARQPCQKEDRRNVILDAALALLDGVPFSDLTMSMLAERAGVAKGTLYLYFPTKEQLLLTLAEELTGRWLAEQQSRLQVLVASDAIEDIALATSNCLLGQSALIQILPIARSVLDQHEGESWSIDYRSRLVNRAKLAGAVVESCFSSASPGIGARFLTYAVALATGLQQLKRKSRTSNKNIADMRAADSFQSSLNDELTLALDATLRGLLSVPNPAR